MQVRVSDVFVFMFSLCFCLLFSVTAVEVFVCSHHTHAIPNTITHIHTHSHTNTGVHQLVSHPIMDQTRLLVGLDESEWNFIGCVRRQSHDAELPI